MFNRSLANMLKGYLTRVRKPLNCDKDRDLEHIDKVYRRYLAGYEGDEWEAFHRVHAQYVYQNKNLYFFSQVFLKNILGFILMPVLMLKILMGFIKLKGKKAKKTKVDGIKLLDISERETPLELCNFNIVILKERNYYLSIKEIIYLVYGLTRAGCWYPEVFFKVIHHVSSISYALSKYSPDFFLFFNEYSCTNSVITHYLKKKHILSINAMHGDKAYGGAGAFFVFDKFYIWHKWYEEYSRSVYAKIDEYIVYRPKRFMTLPCSESGNQLSIGFLFPGYKLERHDFSFLVECIRSLSKDYVICVRPHPRYVFIDEINEIKSINKNIKISNSQSEPFSIFLKDISLVVGYCSTTLIEAYESGRKVICVRDNLIDQIQKYHPYFRPDVIHAVELRNLSSVIRNHFED